VTDKFFGHGPPAGQVLQHALDAFVRDNGHGFEYLAVGFHGFFDQICVSFAQPFAKGFLGDACIFFYQLNAGDLSPKKVFDEFRFRFDECAAARDTRGRVNQIGCT
jgi:hypothetical protein